MYTFYWIFDEFIIRYLILLSNHQFVHISVNKMSENDLRYFYDNKWVISSKLSRLLFNQFGFKSGS